MNTQPTPPRKERTVLGIYAGAVCFIMVMCFTLALAFTGFDVVRYNFPELTVDEYRYSHLSGPGSGTTESESKIPTMDEMVADEKRYALRDMVQQSIVMLVNIVIFALHWLLLRRRN